VLNLLRTSLLIAPGERFELLIDFTSYANGTTIQVLHSAAAPYPGGGLPSASTSQMMQFVVVSGPAFPAPVLSTPLSTVRF
jgi:spore coat protein A